MHINQKVLQKKIIILSKNTIMKTITILLMAITFASCKKEKQCYNCTVGNSVTEYCGDIKNFHPVDSQGNDMSFYCTPK